MKQYCRYCCNACLNDDELAYCRCWMALPCGG